MKRKVSRCTDVRLRVQLGQLTRCCLPSSPCCPHTLRHPVSAPTLLAFLVAWLALGQAAPLPAWRRGVGRRQKHNSPNGANLCSHSTAPQRSESCQALLPPSLWYPEVLWFFYVWEKSLHRGYLQSAMASPGKRRHTTAVLRLWPVGVTGGSMRRAWHNPANPSTWQPRDFPSHRLNLQQQL